MEALVVELVLSRFFVRLAAVATMLREPDGLSQREVARRAGVGRPLISKIERGRANPTATCLDKLANGLGLAGVAELVTLADESATQIAARTTYGPRRSA
ncbi:MAG: helix-turn-helix domain-containing protein [Conexibacter sp.]